MDSRDIERYWERVNEILDTKPIRKETTMKSYGQKESNPGTHLEVLTEHRLIVGFSVHTEERYEIAFLTTQEVYALIKQLSGWLFANQEGR